MLIKIGISEKKIRTTFLKVIKLAENLRIG